MCVHGHEVRRWIQGVRCVEIHVLPYSALQPANSGTTGKIVLQPISWMWSSELDANSERARCPLPPAALPSESYVTRVEAASRVRVRARYAHVPKFFTGADRVMHPVVVHRLIDRLVVDLYSSGHRARISGCIVYPYSDIVQTITPEWEDRIVKFIKAQKSMAAKAPAGQAAHDKDLAKSHPAIHEFLTCAKDDEGKERQTATLTVSCEEGGFKLGLSDREAEQSLWAFGKTLATALDALEGILEGGEGQWRKWGKDWGKGKSRK